MDQIAQQIKGVEDRNLGGKAILEKKIYNAKITVFQRWAAAGLGEPVVATRPHAIPSYIAIFEARYVREQSEQAHAHIYGAGRTSYNRQQPTTAVFVALGEL